MFERDWGRACGKDKFMSMLARENRACAAGKSDKAALAEVHEALKRHYQARCVCVCVCVCMYVWWGVDQAVGSCAYHASHVIPLRCLRTHPCRP